MKSMRLLKGLIILEFIFLSWNKLYAGAEFTAEVDRKQISKDESIAIKFSVKSDGSDTASSPPSFNASDFDVINEYTSTFVESYYDNGQFGMRNTQQLTKILKPKKEGSLTISNIFVEVDGQKLTAPSITIQVESGSGASPTAIARGSVKDTKGFFLKAETNKTRVYRGEQLVVSYYLYRRTRVFNIQVDKYPTLPGFLREDLDMPVLQARLDSERVSVSGQDYDRSLLVRYAAYPLKEGKLELDSIGIKANYYSSQNPVQNDEDDLFNSFFRQMAPLSGSTRSEPVTIDVLSLPETGKPTNFSGIVGDFQVSSGVDKYDVKTGDALTLTVKVEGKGNLSSLTEPKATWPPGIEFYESKGVSKATQGGINEKIFEILLIPREPGTFDLPKLSFVFFDPKQRTYVTRSTDPIKINVTGQSLAASDQKGLGKILSSPQDLNSESERIGSLKEVPSFFSLEKVLQILSMMAWIGFAIILALGLRTWIKKRSLQNKKIAHPSKTWSVLIEKAQSAKAGKISWNEVLICYENLAGAVHDLLDRRFEIESRSFSRQSLEQILVQERKLLPDVWNRIASLLEFSETVRYASSIGAVTETQAREQLLKWIKDAEIVETLLFKS